MRWGAGIELFTVCLCLSSQNSGMRKSRIMLTSRCCVKYEKYEEWKMREVTLWITDCEMFHFFWAKILPRTRIKKRERRTPTDCAQKTRPLLPARARVCVEVGAAVTVNARLLASTIVTCRPWWLISEGVMGLVSCVFLLLPVSDWWNVM